MPDRTILDELPPTRAAILRLLKEEGFSSIPRIAEALGVTHEGARKQIVEMQRNGWISSDCANEEAERESLPGRPPVRYCLTAAGDHFFPKQYAELNLALLDSVDMESGRDVLLAALAQITDRRVAELAPRVSSGSIGDKVRQLCAIYRDRDPYTDVQRRGADYVIIERNCPYLNVAMARPEICSTTISALRRLTGCEVVRERRFQDGDGRCEFYVRTARASRERQMVRFELEPPRTS